MKKLLLIIIGAFLAACAIIAAVVTASAFVSNQVVTDKIHADLKSGDAEFPPVWERNTKTGIDTFVDCLTLEIATFGDKNLMDAFSRAEWIDVIDADHKTVHPCIGIDTKIGPSSPDPSQVEDYWRYWWGSSSLLNIVLGWTSMHLPSYRLALQQGCYEVVLLFGLVAFLRYRHMAWPLMPFVLALLLGFEFPLLGQSIAHAPNFIVGFLLLLIYMLAGIDKAEESWQLGYLYFTGNVVCYFDLLNGSMLAILMTFILARIVAARTYGTCQGLSTGKLQSWPLTVTSISTITAFGLGVISTVALRIVLHTMWLHQNLSGTMLEWYKQLAKHDTETVLHLKAYQSLTALYVYQRLYYNIEAGAFPYIGRHAVVCIYAVCGVLYLVLYGWALRRTRKMYWDTVAAVTLCASIVPAWYMVFAGHSLVQFPLTGRLLALFFALAPCMWLFLKIPPRLAKKD